MSDQTRMPSSYDADISREPEYECEHYGIECEQPCACGCDDCETTEWEDDDDDNE